MIKIDEYKEKRIQELTARLEEIFELVRLETSLNLVGRDDTFAMRLKEQQVDLKKKYFNEMASIKSELAKLQGRESVFDDMT